MGLRKGIVSNKTLKFARSIRYEIMKILFFASLAEVTGTSETQLNGIVSVKVLKEKIMELYPALTGQTFTIAVNQKVVHDEGYPLRDDDEVALLPPFSGG
jgi:molybdopterin synthase sulfur carrier subunit